MLPKSNFALVYACGDIQSDCVLLLRPILAIFGSDHISSKFNGRFALLASPFGCHFNTYSTNATPMPLRWI